MARLLADLQPVEAIVAGLPPTGTEIERPASGRQRPAQPDGAPAWGTPPTPPEPPRASPVPAPPGGRRPAPPPPVPPMPPIPRGQTRHGRSVGGPGRRQTRRRAATALLVGLAVAKWLAGGFEGSNAHLQQPRPPVQPRVIRLPDANPSNGSTNATTSWR
jgi:hypothetical protein